MKKIIQVLHLLFWLAVCQLPGLAGTPAVKNNLEWYHSLTLPPLNPPDALFGLAWGILYLLLGVCAWLVFKQGYRSQKKLLLLFIIQLVLNSLWTPLFFGLHGLGVSFILLIVLLAEAVWLQKELFVQRPKTAWVLVPYVAWLIFAAYLNAAFYLLNA